VEGASRGEKGTKGERGKEKRKGTGDDLAGQLDDSGGRGKSTERKKGKEKGGDSSIYMSKDGLNLKQR